jgi:hypothetical protein
MNKPQPRHPISIFPAVALPWLYQQGISYTDCEALHHLRNRSIGRASLSEATVANRSEQQSSSCISCYVWGTGSPATPMHSFLSGIAAHPFPAKQAHSRLRLETANRYRPYERHPRTNEQSDHYLTLTTDALNSQSNVPYSKTA